MMESQSNEEEDRENLIGRNGVVKVSNQTRNGFAFQIEDNHNATSYGGLKRRYLLAVLFLTLLILVFYYMIGSRYLLATSFDGSGGDCNLVKRMSESELQALSLLKQQESELVKIWNHSTLALGSISLADSSALNRTMSGNASLEGLKSRVFDQILLNKRIQELLLSSHGNESNLSENKSDSGILNLNICNKVDQKLSNRKTIEWNPRSGKYLFAICLSGQMSNHLICLEKHMFFAALLGRILVIPSPKVDYDYQRVLEIAHINDCVGSKVVLTFDEFAVINKDHLHIDRFMCYFSSPQPCFVDDDHVNKLKELGLNLSKIEAVWVEDVKEPKPKTVGDINQKFSSDDDVIAIGDVFFADLEREWAMQPGGPIAHKCKALVEPNRFILLTAQRFVQTFLGRDFVALHFRRHGFLKFCNAKQPSCFYPIPQAAECINRVVQRANNIPVIYLSTDAAASETGLLQSLVVSNYKTFIPLVQRPVRDLAEKWDALLYRHGLDGDTQVEAMLDKTICALSTVFIGSYGSTFTEDILRLRKDWGSASRCDEYLCGGDQPNFVAEDE